MSQRELMRERGFMPASEVARRVGRDTATVYRWIEAEKVKAVRVEDRFWYVNVDSLKEHLGPEASALLEEPGPDAKAG